MTCLKIVINFAILSGDGNGAEMTQFTFNLNRVAKYSLAMNLAKIAWSPNGPSLVGLDGVFNLTRL